MGKPLYIENSWGIEFYVPFWQVAIFVILAFVIVYLVAFLLSILRARGVFDSRASQREPSQAQELEIQERWRGQDALDKYLDQMQQWLDDEDRPLPTLPYDDARRKMARTWTLTILKRLDPNGKRDVLQFLHEHELISGGDPTIRLWTANLSGANLVGMALDNTNLDGVNLRGADLSKASMCSFYGHSASMQAAMARGSTDWEDHKIPDRSTSFSHANLSGTVLKRARLTGCNLLSANFDGADLEEVDLRGTELQLAKNLTQEQIESAFGSSAGHEYMPNTRLPDYLTAPKAWEKLLSQQIKDRGY